MYSMLNCLLLKKFFCICCCLKYGNRQPLTLAMLKVRFGVRLIVFELFPAMSTVSLLKMLIQNNWCSLGKTLIAQSGWRWETNCLLSSMSVISCTDCRSKCQNLTAFLLCDCQFLKKKYTSIVKILRHCFNAQKICKRKR